MYLHYEFMIAKLVHRQQIKEQLKEEEMSKCRICSKIYPIISTDGFCLDCILKYGDKLKKIRNKVK